MTPEYTLPLIYLTTILMSFVGLILICRETGDVTIRYLWSALFISLLFGICLWIILPMYISNCKFITNLFDIVIFKKKKGKDE